MRKEIFAGNWKMNTNAAEAVKLVRGIVEGLVEKENRDVVVFPPDVYASLVNDIISGSAVYSGLQNIYYEESGAFTGEISPLMLKDIGCTHTLIGHSERRHIFAETDELVNRKTKAALKHDIIPVVCVGELLEEKESGLTGKVVKKQVEKALQGISAEDMKKLVIAYEPVWAIGTGKVATPEIAEDVHALIRELLEDLYGTDVSDVVPVIYGGSVKPDNIEGLYSKPNIDGVLVGGASLKIDSFLDIINV